ncbi:MAG TPA: TonB C-terminal domain-containing protein [Drouetiella sp.]
MQSRKLMVLMSVAMAVTCLAATAKPAARPAGHAAPASGASNKGTAANVAYLTRLRGKLMNNWNPPSGKNHAILTTTVNADGTVGDVALSSTPKSADAEIAASEAFAKSQPLEALPGGGQSKLTLTYESNADPHGDSNCNIYTQITPIAAPKTATPPADPGAAK